MRVSWANKSEIIVGSPNKMPDRIGSYLKTIGTSWILDIAQINMWIRSKNLAYKCCLFAYLGWVGISVCSFPPLGCMLHEDRDKEVNAEQLAKILVSRVELALSKHRHTSGQPNLDASYVCLLLSYILLGCASGQRRQSSCCGGGC